jgi:hypothetical protein
MSLRVGHDTRSYHHTAGIHDVYLTRIPVVCKLICRHRQEHITIFVPLDIQRVTVVPTYRGSVQLAQLSYLSIVLALGISDMEADLPIDNICASQQFDVN